MFLLVRLFVLLYFGVADLADWTSYRFIGMEFRMHQNAQSHNPNQGCSPMKLHRNSFIY